MSKPSRSRTRSPKRSPAREEVGTRTVRIVTDSTADIRPEVAQRLGISTLPVRIHFGRRETYLDGVELTPRAFFRKVSQSQYLPTTSPPSLEEFQRTFARLAQEKADVLALHVSSKLSNTYRVAREAAEPFLGQTRIWVMDSQTTSLSLGALVVAAAEAARRGAPLDDIVRLVRGMMPHLYLVFFVKNLDYLSRGGRIAASHALLGSMLGIKPLLIVEDGDIVPLEKVKSKGKAVERLFEFITEFPSIEKITVLHGTDGIELPELLHRLETAFPKLEVGVAPYGPALATHVGPNALGIFVYESIRWRSEAGP